MDLEELDKILDFKVQYKEPREFTIFVKDAETELAFMKPWGLPLGEQNNTGIRGFVGVIQRGLFKITIVDINKL